MTAEFPKTEKYGLASQMQRAAVSTPANIAEGYGRDSRKEYIYHLSVAKGSLTELETHLIISQKLEYINEIKFKEIWEQTQITGKLLSGLQNSLKNPKPNTLNPIPHTLNPK